MDAGKNVRLGGSWRLPQAKSRDQADGVEAERERRLNGDGVKGQSAELHRSRSQAAGLRLGGGKEVVVQLVGDRLLRCRVKMPRKSVIRAAVSSVRVGVGRVGALEEITRKIARMWYDGFDCTV